MKWIEAIVRPQSLGRVKSALTGLGVDAMTILEVKDLGSKAHTEVYRGAEYRIECLPRVKLELALPDELLDRALDAIFEASGGNGGAGAIYVFELARVVRAGGAR